jgi:adenylate cyclase
VLDLPTLPAHLRSLRVRWSATLLLVAALPIFSLAWVTARTVRTGLADTERELQLTILDATARTLVSDLEYAEESTHRVARSLLDVDAGSAEARVRQARDATARAVALLHVAVYTTSGERVDTIYGARSEAREPAPLDRIPADLLRAPPRSGAWLPAQFTPSGVALRYVEALSDAGNLRMWVVSTLDPRWLATLVEQVSVRQYDTGRRVLVVDKDLRTLVPGVTAVGTSLARQDIFQSAEFLRNQRDEEQRDVSLSMEYRDRGVPMVGAYRALRRMRWFIAVRRTQSEAYKALTEARNVLSFGALACVTLAALFGTWMARRTTRPIEQLESLARSYAARSFSTRSTVKTGDELQALGETLEGMADKLQESEIEIARRARIETDLSRFLPSEVAGAVARGEKSLTLGGERRDVTVLFADVASFTSFAERASPEKVVAFLNELFTVLTEVVFRHGGMVDKFVGDCVMAVFGTGSDPRDAAVTGADTPASRALAAAEDIHRFVEASAPAWLDAYGLDVRLGIGVNRGEALVGNLGSESRMEFTVIGDVVNVAARLEGIARGGQTLATGSVVRAVGQRFTYNPLGAHPLRGKRELVEIFEVIP